MLTLFSNGHPLSEIGIKSLKGYLEYHGILVRAIYLDQAGILPPDIIDQVLELTAGSDLVGFSLMSKDVVEFQPIIKAIREKQNIPVVLGGIHPTALPRESLELGDFVCLGEGEEPLRMLYEKIKKGETDYNISNIGYHQDREKIINPPAYFVESLDKLPFPDYSFKNSYLFLHEEKKIVKIPDSAHLKNELFKCDTLIFYSQRGCRYACTYCSNSLYHRMAGTCGKKWYRMSSPARVKEEIRHYLEIMPFITKINLNDDDFLARDIEGLKEISSFLKNEVHLPFTINAIPGYVTEDKIAILVKNGLTKIGFGVQSGSPRILKEVFRRAQTSEMVQEAARIVAKYGTADFTGLYANYGFILDNPYDTDDDWRKSLRLLISLPRPRTINLYSLAFFPGTELSKMAIRDGHITDTAMDFDKKYQEDLQYSYRNTLFFMNRAHLPLWLNNFLMSDLMVKSKVTSPLRYAMKNRDLVLGMMEVIFKAKGSAKKIKTALNIKSVKKLANRTKRRILDKYEIWQNPLPANESITPAQKGWSIVVITSGGSAETLHKCLESAAVELGGENCEIIVVGPADLKVGGRYVTPLKIIGYADTKKLPGLITRKKNIGAAHAKYDKVAICHDYIVFKPGWKKGFDGFGDDFEICVNRISNYDGTRYIDWAVWDYPNIGPGLLPYDSKCNEYQYISGAYFVVKRNFFLANPLNENLRWGEAEDIEWSKRIRKKTKFKFNPLSRVGFSKPKEDTSSYWLENTKKITKIISQSAEL